jgi:cytochrome c biogenesis protein CcdA
MTPRRLFCLLASLLSPVLLLAAPAPRLVFSPAEWKFAMIIQGTVIEQELTVRNLEPAAVTVTLIPTCSCNRVVPGSQTIPAGASAVFLMRYDSIDDRGVTTKSFVVKTDVPGAPAFYYWIRGTVRESNRASAASGTWTRQGSNGSANGGTSGPGAVPGSGPGEPVRLSYYYTPGCRSCEEFLAKEVPLLEKRLGRRILIDRRDLLDTTVYEELSAFAAAHGPGLTAIPALRAGDVLLQGDGVIREKLPGVLESLLGASTVSAPPAASPAGTPVTAALAVFPVIAAGLIDGINPCAFTTLIFLLASLALAGRGRREVLVIGALFSFAVFLSYFLIGLGLFTALRAAAAVSIVSVLLRWIIVGVLFVFAGLSVYDYTRIRAGHPTEMLLQLPSSFKKRIHASIRTRVRTAALAGSSLVLGFLVSVFEFACTGQVYLPLLGYIARVNRRLDGIGLLALYNLCFIVPLLLVFGASYLGVSSGRITAAFQAHMGKAKLGLAVVFIGLAVFTLVG